MKLKMIIAGILLPLLAPAQRQANSLTIGDEMPALILSHLYNYAASSVNTRTLRGRLLILDFWSTYCGACIEAIPEAQHLQAQFGKKMQVILVNVYPRETPALVQRFFQRYRARTGTVVSLPYSLMQSQLPALLPFNSIPHYVWVSPQGKIIAITSQTELTAENIRLALHDSAQYIHLKKSLMSFSNSAPLFVNGNGGADTFYMYRSLFSRYLNGVSNISGVQKNEAGKITRLYMINAAPVSLLAAAYPSLLNLPRNRIILSCRNAHLFTADAVRGDSLYTNSFCYDLQIPPSNYDRLTKFVRDDMNRYLGVAVHEEAKEMNCLLLASGPFHFDLAAKETTRAVDIDPASIHKYLHDVPLSEFISLLNRLPAFSSLPVIDESNTTGNVDIELPRNFYSASQAELIDFLRSIGFIATEQHRSIQMAIITDQ